MKKRLRIERDDYMDIEFHSDSILSTSEDEDIWEEFDNSSVRDNIYDSTEKLGTAAYMFSDIKRGLKNYFFTGEALFICLALAKYQVKNSGTIKSQIYAKLKSFFRETKFERKDLQKELLMKIKNLTEIECSAVLTMVYEFFEIAEDAFALEDIGRIFNTEF